MPKLRRNGQQNKGKVNVLGAACLILAVVYALAYFSVFDNGIMSFAGKVQAYLLGKCALLLPLTLLLAAVQLLLFDKIYLLNKKTLAYFMVTLCLLGTAHHVFIPAGEELAPASLPVGGGLLGALIALGMHKIAGYGYWNSGGAGCFVAYDGDSRPPFTQALCLGQESIAQRCC